MRFSILSLALLFTTNVWAAISVTGISGASSVNLSGTPTMFGALGGAECGNDVANSATRTCDSCRTASVVPNCTATAPLCVCSETRIHANLQAHITLKKDTADVGDAKVMIQPAATGTTTAAGTVLTLTSAANGGNSVDFTWGQICNALDNTHSTCGAGMGSFTGTLTIWIDKNNDNAVTTDEPQTTVSVRVINPDSAEAVFGATGSDGIGAFTAFPGDGKVFIENTKAGSGFPNLAGGSIATSLRVFIDDAKLDNAYPKGLTLSPGSDDLGIDSTTNELTAHTVKNLENGKVYFFRIAIVDNAGNVLQYFPPYTGNDPTCNDGTGTNCPYAATPDQVLGLLSKDVNCFIATAAYGSTMEPKLQTFRDFRYKILLRHEWGIRFVKWYYNYGPKAAQFIFDKPALRAVARGLLWPVFGFTWMSLRLGLVPAALLFLMLFTALTIPLWLSFRRSTPRV